MPNPWTDIAIESIAYLLLILGLVGAVVPVLPGPILVWVGALLWASVHDFQLVGWPTLIVLGAIALLAWGLDLLMTTVFSRRAGASWRAILAAIVGALIGGISLTFGIPILGTVIGAIVGAAAGMWLFEYRDKRDAPAATRAVRAYVGSMIVSSLIEFGFILLMLAIFSIQAFWLP